MAFMADGVDSHGPLAAERELVARCLDGAAGAWNALYDRYHPRLCRSIAGWLATAGDGHLAEEIAARVWFALVADGGRRLARFDSTRGARLISYLRALARDELSRHFRSERRRRRRERWAAPSHAGGHKDEHGEQASCLADFEATLTPSERHFLKEHLLGAGSPASLPTPSAAGRWQARHRIHRKFLAFLAERH